MADVSLDDCTTCTALAAALAPGASVTCPACGAELRRAPVPSDTRARHAPTPRVRPPSPPSLAPDRLLRAVVAELLSWDRAVASVERAARGSASPLAGVLQVLELGVLGTGCRGTKGVGHAPTAEPSSLAVDPHLSGRYSALHGLARRCADAVLLDGRGDALADVTCGPRVLVDCTLPQRVGLLLADDAQRATWQHKAVVGRDERAVRLGAHALGETALAALVGAWYATAEVAA